MRLVVVVGDREYLTPKPIPREHLLRLLARIDPNASVPEFRWTGNEESDHSLLLREHPGVVDLALEYLADAAPSSSTSFLVLPAEPYSVERASAPASDARVRAVVRRARQIGIEVRCVRLFLSRTTRAVMARLHDRSGNGLSASPLPNEPADEMDLPESIEITSLLSDASEVDRDALEAFQFNYTYAVLDLGESLVRPQKVFAGSRRAAVVSECLEQNRLLLRPDLSPERIEAELEPGGEIFELLRRPLPRAPVEEEAPDEPADD